MRFGGSFILSFLLISVLVGQAAAQTPEVTTTPSPLAATASPSPEATVATSPTIAPSVSPAVTASPVVSPSLIPGRFAIFRLRVSRIFAKKDSARRGELTRQIAEALYARVLADAAAGETGLVAQGLDRYNREANLIETIVDVLKANTTDPTIIAFLDQVALDKSAQLAALDALQTSSGTGNATSIANKIIATRAKAIRSLVKVLDNSTLTEEQRQEKIAKIMNKYSEKETKIEEKISKRLAFKTELATASEDETILTSLDTAEDTVVAEAEELTDDQRASLLTSLNALDSDHSLAVLLKLRDRVPEAAQAGIDTALNAHLDQKIKTLEANPQALKALAALKSLSPELREKILERLREKSSEKLKKEIETHLEKVKDDGKKRELKKKETTSGTSKIQQRTVSPKPTSSSPLASSPKTSEQTATPTVQATTVEIKVKDGALDKASYLVDRNSKLTIKLKNEDSKPYTFALASGRTQAMAALSEVSMPSFLFAGTLGFTVKGDAVQLSGTLEAK